jgi:hypothetical protein
MASKGFTKNSSGKSFTETSNGVTDLSSLAEGSILAGSSQSGGNMITDKTTSLQLATPGTVSEQTDTNALGAHLAATPLSDPAAAPSQNFRKEVH